jgi:predicted ATPase
LRSGLAIAEEGLSLAARLGDPYLLTRSRFEVGAAHLYLGNLAAARPHFEEGLALYDPERDRTNAVRYGFDPGMGCRSYLGVAFWLRGFPDKGLRHAEEANAAARAAAHPLSEAWAYSFAEKLHQLRGEVTHCYERADAALAVATEQILPFYAARAETLVGWALVKKGEADEGLARLRAGINGGHAVGTRVWRLPWLALLAEACLATARIEEGLSALGEALAETEETEARFYEAETRRLEGELRLSSKQPDEKRAEASFRKAIGIARGQRAKSWELRAATSLARLLSRQGRREEAQALLAPVYGWFTEGFDTADLVAAKALLEQLTP